MEVSDRKPPAPQTTESGKQPSVRELQPTEPPRQEAAGGHDEGPIEEPGYGHGV